MDNTHNLLILAPSEWKKEAQKSLKIAFDHIKVAHDSLIEHKIMTQQLEDRFTKVAEIILELGKEMNPPQEGIIK